MPLGERLKELRTAKNLSVREAADKLGKSPGYVSRLEVRGEIPSPELLIEIASAYGADVDELLRLSKEDVLTRTGQEIDEKQRSAVALYRKSKT